MKKNVKHNFAHKDPEKEPAKPVQSKSGRVKDPDIPNYILSDLKTVLITCGVFTSVIIGLYLLQTKTEFLNPVLRYFSL